MWLNREQAQIIGIYLGRTIAKVDNLLGARFIGSLPPIDLTNLPEPDDQKAQLALALYREALELNVPAYQFLGFFKILNVIHASGSAQIIWINKTIEKLSGAGASRIIDIRTNLGPSDTIGNYLFVSGRCSIAHAYGDPIVNPDRSVDIRRIDDDPCVIRQLAEIAMNEELRIKKRFDSVDSLNQELPMPGLSDAAVIDVHAHVVLAETMGAAGPHGPELTTADDGLPLFRAGGFKLHGVPYAESPFMQVGLRLERMAAAG